MSAHPFPASPGHPVGMDQAARLMRVLGDDAGPVWAELSAAEALTLRAAMDRAGSDPAADTGVARSFAIASRQSSGSRASHPRAGQPTATVWEGLATVSPELLAGLLAAERPCISALILSRLDPEPAAAALRLMQPVRAVCVMQSLLNGAAASDTAIRALEEHFNRHLPALRNAAALNGHERLARILDRFNGDAETDFLAALESAEPGSGQKVRSLMFTFEDLGQLDAAGIQTLLAASDRVTLTLALKGAGAGTLAVFLSNMTQRAGDLLREEIAALGPVRRSEVEAARQDILTLARRLIRLGEIRTGAACDDLTDELVE